MGTVDTKINIETKTLNSNRNISIGVFICRSKWISFQSRSRHVRDKVLTSTIETYLRSSKSISLSRWTIVSKNDGSVRDLWSRLHPVFKEKFKEKYFYLSYLKVSKIAPGINANRAKKEKKALIKLLFCEGKSW